MASIKVKLKQKKYENGEFPIVLQIIKNRKSKIISLGFFSKQNTWDSKTGLYKPKHVDSTVLNIALEEIKLKAQLILLEFEEEEINFTLGEFENKFRTSTNETLSVFDYWNEIIAEMDSTGRFGNSDVNKDTMRSIRKFYGNDNLMFNQVNVYFLEKYEVFLRENGGTNGGIGVKMRAIRALYNSAIRRGFVKKNKYPFIEYKISRLKSNPVKRALPIDFIRKIETLKNLETNRLINAKNYFLFSFYTRGMNFTDMAHLKWSDLSENRIYYIRSKTGANFNIKITPPIQQILDYYELNGNATKYIFPILYREDYDPKQIKNRKKKMLKEYNKDLKQIAMLCNINKPFTSYAARHSFANCLVQNGTSIDIVSQSMGHSSVLVTKAYVKDLGNLILDDACEILLK